MEAVRRPPSNTPSLFALSVASVISCSRMKGFEQEATEKTESVRQVFCVCLRIAGGGPSYSDDARATLLQAWWSVMARENPQEIYFETARPALRIPTRPHVHTLRSVNCGTAWYGGGATPSLEHTFSVCSLRCLRYLLFKNEGF